MEAQANLRILIIDDNPAIHQDFKKILLIEQTEYQFEASRLALFGNEFYNTGLVIAAFQQFF